MFDVRFLKTTIGLSKNPNAVTLNVNGITIVFTTEIPYGGPHE